MKITTLTTRYDPREDRISLDIADAEGYGQRRWLTERLLRGLLVNLLKHTELSLTDVEGDPQRSQAANIYAQLQARLTHKAHPAVQVSNGTSGELITAIDITMSKGAGVQLSFRTSGQEADTLSLDAQELRQWLQALYRATQQAAWFGLWPSWMKQSPRLPFSS